VKPLCECLWTPGAIGLSPMTYTRMPSCPSVLQIETTGSHTLTHCAARHYTPQWDLTQSAHAYHTLATSLSLSLSSPPHSLSFSSIRLLRIKLPTHTLLLLPTHTTHTIKKTKIYFKRFIGERRSECAMCMCVCTCKLNEKMPSSMTSGARQL
jgi:hypothetical protein